MELRDWLFYKRKTQRELAKELNVTESYISMIKQKRSIPSIGLAKRIEKYTKGDVTVDELRRKRPIAKVKARLQSKFA